SKEVYQKDYPEPRRRVLFHWQGLRLLQEVQSGLASLYVYATPDSYEPLARIDGSMGREVVQYFHTNLAGLPEQLTDANGNAIWRSDYEGWGKTRDEWHSPRQAREQNLRYQGQHLDRETGLHYNTFRFYDPDIARFIQTDPIGLAGGTNLFLYASNSFTWIDPWGWNKNSHSSIGDWVLYDVIDPVGGHAKTGIGKAEDVMANGANRRAHASARKVRKDPSFENAYAKIISRHKNITKGEMKEIEAERVRTLRSQGLALPHNKERDNRYNPKPCP
ncbi:RHS repeat domain-containing protein, partial [Pseudomonas sp. CGJS7]